MAAVRFSDMQGKSHWMAISPYFLRTSQKKTSPAAARRRDTVIGDLLYRRAAVGEGLAGWAPEGPASPKGFTGWGGPGKSEADFSSGEQTVDGNS